jgi:hypothetical protein
LAVFELELLSVKYKRIRMIPTIANITTCKTDMEIVRESRFRKSAQDDKWSFCLTVGTLCPANQERP